MQKTGIAVGLVALAIAGCGSDSDLNTLIEGAVRGFNSDRKIERAVHELIRSSEAGDAAAACRLLTRETRQRLGGHRGCLAKIEKVPQTHAPPGYEIARLVSNDSTAVATLKPSSQPPIHLRKVNGNWLVELK